MVQNWSLSSNSRANRMRRQLGAVLDMVRGSVRRHTFDGPGDEDCADGRGRDQCDGRHGRDGRGPRPLGRDRLVKAADAPDGID